MSKHQKVVWYEGMSLDPHHFQQLDRYHQNALQTRIEYQNANHWGLIEFEIDSDALSNGQFQIRRCKGFLEDGFFFDIPDNHQVNRVVNLEEYFEATAANLGIYLAIPQERPGAINCQLPDKAAHKEIRYALNQLELGDDNNPADRREIGISKPNLRLMFDNQSRDNFSAIKIAEVIRDSNGNYALSDNFIPACLAIKANKNLESLGTRLLELLSGKGRDLLKRRRQQPSGQVEYSSADITIFWLLHTVNSIIPVLRHQLLQNSHPEKLFETMLMLGGQLTSFSYEEPDIPVNLPEYEHDNLTRAFNALSDHVLQLLQQAVPPTSYIPITLQRHRNFFYVGKVKDTALLADCSFFLLVEGTLGASSVEHSVPNKFRMASPNTINKYIQAASQALPMEYQSRPPVGTPMRPELKYFELKKSSPIWKDITKESTFVVYVPAEMLELKVEMIAVKKGA